MDQSSSAVPAPEAAAPAVTQTPHPQVSSSDRVPVLAWVIAAVFVAVELAVSDRYGFLQDELYFIVAGRHLAFGYVDQPPLAPLLTRITDVFGVSPTPIRIVPALAGGAVVVMAARFAALFGAGRFGRPGGQLAQAMAAPEALRLGSRENRSTARHASRSENWCLPGPSTVLCSTNRQVNPAGAWSAAGCWPCPATGRKPQGAQARLLRAGDACGVPTVPWALPGLSRVPVGEVPDPAAGAAASAPASWPGQAGSRGKPTARVTADRHGNSATTPPAGSPGPAGRGTPCPLAAVCRRRGLEFLAQPPRGCRVCTPRAS